MAKLSGKALGQWGEALAADYLIEKGYQVLYQNFRTPYGEIDIVVQKDNVTVFVEVKTRSNTLFGYPEEAITARKRENLIESAQAFLQDRPDIEGDWRIDVIAIQRLDASENPLIDHFENAIN